MEFAKKEVKIFLLSGKARSGKETVSSMIKDYYSSKKVISISFAGYLKEYAKNISGWDGSEETKPRELLQQLGIELIKEKIDNKLFIRRVLEDIEVYSYFFDVIIITDARLVDEVESVKNKYKDAVTIRIVRDNYESNLTSNQKKHITETGLDGYDNFDYIVSNNELNKLKVDIDKILKEVDYE